MKHTVKILSLVILGTLLLSGCNLLNKEEVTSTTAEVVSADTVLDQQIYKRAIDSKDAKACDTIKDEAVKSECGDVVNALVLTDKAVSELDEEFCGDIKLERYEEECENRVASILEQQEVEEEKQAEIAKQEEERLNVEKEAVNTGDYTICNQLKEERTQAFCKYNTLASKAINTKDETLCDKIGLEELVNLCKANILN